MKVAKQSRTLRVNSSYSSAELFSIIKNWGFQSGFHFLMVDNPSVMSSSVSYCGTIVPTTRPMPIDVRTMGKMRGKHTSLFYVWHRCTSHHFRSVTATPSAFLFAAPQGSFCCNHHQLRSQWVGPL